MAVPNGNACGIPGALRRPLRQMEDLLDHPILHHLQCMVHRDRGLLLLQEQGIMKYVEHPYQWHITQQVCTWTNNSNITSTSRSHAESKPQGTNDLVVETAHRCQPRGAALSLQLLQFVLLLLHPPAPLLQVILRVRVLDLEHKWTRRLSRGWLQPVVPELDT